MVREMKDARVTARDIDENIDRMVTAVFYITDKQLVQRKEDELLTSLGRLGGNLVA
jgi:hypothetical protein